MFGSLAEAVEELEIPASGPAIAEAVALSDRLAAKLTDAVGRFDADQGWALDHEPSASAWLRNHTGMTRRAANQLTQAASLLRRLPFTAAAFGDGRLSHGQVEAILANLSERTVEVFADGEADIVPTLVPLTTVDVAQVMRVWRQHTEATLDDEESPEEQRELYLSPTLDGRFEGRCSLDSEGGTVVRTALRLAERRDDDGDDRSPARRRADALVDIAQHYLDTQHANRGGRHRPHVNVVITLDDLEQRHGGRFDNGGLVPASTVEALLCDCNLHRVITDGAGTILDYGRSTRTFPINLYNALVVRDQHCRVSGCDVPGDRCDAHHVTPWENGGMTSIDNGVLKCRRHHHLHHQPGWRDTLLPDGTYIVTDPAGTTRTTRPPGTIPLADTG